MAHPIECTRLRQLAEGFDGTHAQHRVSREDVACRHDVQQRIDCFGDAVAADERDGRLGEFRVGIVDGAVEQRARHAGVERQERLDRFEPHAQIGVMGASANLGHQRAIVDRAQQHDHVSHDVPTAVVQKFRNVAHDGIAERRREIEQTTSPRSIFLLGQCHEHRTRCRQPQRLNHSMHLRRALRRFGDAGEKIIDDQRRGQARKRFRGRVAKSRLAVRGRLAKPFDDRQCIIEASVRDLLVKRRFDPGQQHVRRARRSESPQQLKRRIDELHRHFIFGDRFRAWTEIGYRLRHFDAWKLKRHIVQQRLMIGRIESVDVFFAEERDEFMIDFGLHERQCSRDLRRIGSERPEKIEGVACEFAIVEFA